VVGKLPAPNFAHANEDLAREHLPHLQDSKPSTPVLIVDTWDIFSLIAHYHDASHPFINNALHGQIGKRRVPATKNVSTTCRYLKLLQELIRYLLPPRSQ